MFIVLEGIDGSGKSSLAELLAGKFGSVVYATPPEKYRKLRKQVDTGSSAQKHYDFYRDAVVEASAEIAILLSTGQSVVCDRYWLSTLVYHRAGGMILDGSDFSKLVQPDLTVFLFVSPEVQVTRLTNREGGGGNIEGKQSELTNLYLQALADSKLPFLVINTDNFSLEQCGDIVSTAVSTAKTA